MSTGKSLSNLRLDGKTAILTECTTRNGKCNVLDFYLRGGKIIMACEEVKKAAEVRDEVYKVAKEKNNLGTIEILELNLSSLQSIRVFSKRILASEERIDILVNNASIVMCPALKTSDGFEMHFGTNHLGHYLLTILLLPRMIKSGTARIINITSAAYFNADEMDFKDLNWENTRYSPAKAFARSKLANVLFTKELDKKLRSKQIHVNCYAVTPGFVTEDLSQYRIDTSFSEHVRMDNVFLQPPTQIYCAIDEKAGEESGLYYERCKVVTPSDEALDEEAAKRLWDESWKLVKLGSYNPFFPN